MAGKNQILIRMNDVAMTLRAADNCNQKLNRIKLQKFIYLTDIVGYVFEMLPPQKAHITYKRGPFDASIQNAVDTLVFRGLAEASGVHKDVKGNIHAIYGLTSAGKNWLDEMKQKAEFSQHWYIASEVARQLEVLGWSRLVSLVYAEPTFASAKALGFGKRLVVNDGMKDTAAHICSSLDLGLRSGFPESSPNKELIVELLFRYLDRYARLESQNAAIKAYA